MHLLLFRSQRWEKVIKGRTDSIIRNKIAHLLSYLLLAFSFFTTLLHWSEKPKVWGSFFMGQALAFWQSIVESFCATSLNSPWKPSLLIHMTSMLRTWILSRFFYMSMTGNCEKIERRFVWWSKFEIVFQTFGFPLLFCVVTGGKKVHFFVP